MSSPRFRLRFFPVQSRCPRSQNWNEVIIQGSDEEVLHSLSLSLSLFFSSSSLWDNSALLLIFDDFTLLISKLSLFYLHRSRSVQTHVVNN